MEFYIPISSFLYGAEFADIKGLKEVMNLTQILNSA